jgi:hypothetical protein
VNDTCDYFLFDERHPTYGHLCGKPATREVGFADMKLDVCEEHAQSAERGSSSLLASYHNKGHVN